MSIGTRIVRHGQVTVCASLAATPREPLQFLYPAWARNSFTTINQHRLDTSSTPRLRKSIHSASDATDYARLSHMVDGSSQRGSAIESVTRGDVYTSSSSQKRTQLSTPISKASGDKISEPAVGRQQSKADKRKERAVRRDNLQLRIHQLRQILAENKHFFQEKKQRAEARHLWQAQRDEALQRERVADWRQTLKRLSGLTLQHDDWLDDAVTILVSKYTAAILLNGLDEDIRVIVEAHDGMVRFGDSADGAGDRQSFLLSGTAVSISTITARLLKIAPDAEVKRTSISAAAETAILPSYRKSVQGARVVRNSSGRLRSRSNSLDVSMPDPPVHWDSCSFLAYVRRFTVAKRSLATSNILRALFTDDAYRPYITNMALREIFAYYVRENSVPDIRALFNFYEITDPEIFNIMMRMPAKANDIYNYDYVLYLMSKRGYIPNRRTWLSFLQTNDDSPDIQLAILSEMVAKGLVQHPLAIQQVCVILAPLELEVTLFMRDSQAQFSQILESMYGPDWLTLSAANRILHVLGSKGLIDQCCDFLQFMASHSVKANEFSINTLLRHCKHGRNLPGAMEVLKLAATLGSLKPNKETYGLLFETAWQSRSYNVARAVWRYACLSRATTFQMRRRVKTSFRRNCEDLTLASPRYRFQALAGRFVFASHDRINPSRDGKNAVPEGHDSLMPSIYSPVSLDRADDLMRQELDSSSSLFATKSFIAILEEAFKMDQGWKVSESRTGQKKDLDWMLEHGINTFRISRKMPLIRRHLTK